MQYIQLQYSLQTKDNVQHTKFTFSARAILSVQLLVSILNLSHKVRGIVPSIAFLVNSA